jgi:hypothetical protein
VLFFTTGIGKAEIHEFNFVFFNHFQDFCGGNCQAYLLVKKWVSPRWSVVRATKTRKTISRKRASNWRFVDEQTAFILQTTTSGIEPRSNALLLRILNIAPKQCKFKKLHKLGAKNHDNRKMHQSGATHFHGHCNNRAQAIRAL